MSHLIRVQTKDRATSNGKKGTNFHGRKRVSPEYRLFNSQMRNLFHIYHSLALAADAIGDPIVIASTTKLKELLFSIPHSELCNPMKDMPAENVYDLEALR